MKFSILKPWVSRNIYRFQECVFQRPTFSYLVELESSQWLTRHEIEQLQLIKLQHLLKTAERHCPWHSVRIQAAGINLSTPLTLEEFQKLPVMDKADASANLNQLVWEDVPGGASRYSTGGSSGKPLIFILESCVRLQMLRAECGHGVGGEWNRERARCIYGAHPLS